MKTGIDARPSRRRALAGLAALPLLVAAGSPTAAVAAGFDLAALMALLAGKPRGEARFTEQRYVTGLDAPLASRGRLAFEAPDRLSREVTEPRRESFVVDGNDVTLARGGRSRSVTLDSVPELAAVVEALRGTLTGNAAALQKHFRTRVEGTPEAWTLALVPIELGLTTQVRSVTLTGRGGEVLGIEMEYAGGDRSVTSIEPMRAAPKR